MARRNDFQRADPMGYAMLYVALKPHLVEEARGEKPKWLEIEEAISEKLEYGDFQQMGKAGGGFNRYGVLIPQKSVQYTTQAAQKIDLITFKGGWGLEAAPVEDQVKYKLHEVYLFTPDSMIVEAMADFANIGKIKRYKHGSIPGAFTTTVEVTITKIKCAIPSSIWLDGRMTQVRGQGQSIRNNNCHKCGRPGHIARNCKTDSEGKRVRPRPVQAEEMATTVRKTKRATPPPEHDVSDSEEGAVGGAPAPPKETDPEIEQESEGNEGEEVQTQAEEPTNDTPPPAPRPKRKTRLLHPARMKWIRDVKPKRRDNIPSTSEPTPPQKWGKQ